jgi:hydroxymethylpyrimidine/phosphomethylpyrimidine kinase
MRTAAQAIYALGPRHVVVKGGHRAADPVDVYFDGKRFFELRTERIETRHTHGTGCTFSAAITAFIARGLPVNGAIASAKNYITEAIRHAPGLGNGHGPVGHFWQWQ